MYFRAVHGAVQLEWVEDGKHAGLMALSWLISLPLESYQEGAQGDVASLFQHTKPAGAFVVLILTAGNQVFLGDTSLCPL